MIVLFGCLVFEVFGLFGFLMFGFLMFGLFGLDF
jgi:hypothetical protein